MQASSQDSPDCQRTQRLPEALHLPWGPTDWDCWTPAELASKLAAVEARWCVVGGWALDLYTGVTHREHSDLEIIVSRQSFPQLHRALTPEVSFFVAGAEGQWPVETAGIAFDQYQQTFARDEASGKFVLDVMRVADTGEWQLATHPEVTRPWDQTIGSTETGVPFLQPEQVLLYKALGINEDQEPRPKDSGDLLYVLPFLGVVARTWLSQTLASLRPTHPWLRALALFRAE